MLNVNFPFSTGCMDLCDIELLKQDARDLQVIKSFLQNNLAGAFSSGSDWGQQMLEVQVLTKNFSAACG